MLGRDGVLPCPEALRGYDGRVTPRRSRAAFAATLVASLTFAGCINAAQPSTPAASVSSAPASTSAAPSTVPELTFVPGRSGGASPVAAASPPTQTDTEWGRIWDALPPSFPLPPDAVATETGEGPASASLAVGANAKTTSDFLQSALTAAGYAFESVEGPSEDGSFTLNAIGRDPGCLVQVRVRPLSGTTNVVVMYGAGCPFA